MSYYKMENKKGSVRMGMIFLIVFSFVAVILLGIFVYAFNTITISLLDKSVMVGAVNLTNATSDTLGQLNNGINNNANLIGAAFLFGMVIGLIAAAYFTRKQNPALFFAIDIILIIFFYILSTYIANAYETTLNVIPFASTFTDTLPLASGFLLNLPLITIITGAIVMLVSYAAIPQTQEEEVAGF